MKIVAIIQARMGSTRLPGKVLLDVGGDSVLARVIERARRAECISEFVVATTDASRDDPVVKECERLGCAFFRGSEHDVLDRYHRAAIAFAADSVVRITSDCPLLDPRLVDETVGQFLKHDADYASNGITPSYPRGLDVEVFTSESLALAWRRASKLWEREHVTPYLYFHPEQFRIVSVRSSVDHSQYRWTLDTEEDLTLIREIYSRLTPHPQFGWEQVVTLMKQEPRLVMINASVEQKPVFAS